MIIMKFNYNLYATSFFLFDKNVLLTIKEKSPAVSIYCVGISRLVNFRFHQHTTLELCRLIPFVNGVSSAFSWN